MRLGPMFPSAELRPAGRAKSNRSRTSQAPLDLIRTPPARTHALQTVSPLSSRFSSSVVASHAAAGLLKLVVQTGTMGADQDNTSRRNVRRQ